MSEQTSTRLVVSLPHFSVVISRSLPKLWHFLQIALGRGETELAIKMLKESAQNGYWLILKNLHLMISWIPTLEKEFRSISKVHEEFRLWLTSEPHSSLPSVLVQDCLKVTYEVSSTSGVYILEMSFLFVCFFNCLMWCFYRPLKELNVIWRGHTVYCQKRLTCRWSMQEPRLCCLGFTLLYKRGERLYLRDGASFTNLTIPTCLRRWMWLRIGSKLVSLVPGRIKDFCALIKA